MKVKFMILAAFIFLVAISKKSIACSAFTIAKDSKVLMFKSYDWHFGSGMLMYNPANFQKKSMPVSGDFERLSWNSKYASITFNQYGQNLPNGGINETGLSIEVLWLESTKYQQETGKKALNELQWIQYALDNFNNVDELVEQTSEIIVVPFYAKVHYFVCDASGNCAVIEFMNGKRVVHSGKQMPHQAITNSSYQQSIYGLKNPEHSCERFNTICSSIHDSTEASIANGFKILDQVKGDRTQWQIAYDIKNKTIHFKIKSDCKVKSLAKKSKINPTIKSVQFDRFDSSNSKYLYMDLHNKEEFSVQNFKKSSTTVNYNILQEAFTNLKLPVPDSACEIIAQYITNGKEHPQLQHIIDSFAGIDR